MTEIVELEIGKIKLVRCSYENPDYNSISFEWFEESSDHYHSGQDISIEIEKNDAIKLVAALKSHFDI